MSIPEALELGMTDFYTLYRDAFLYNNMRSEEGNRRLDDAWILEQVKPNRDALRELKGGMRSGK